MRVRSAVLVLLVTASGLALASRAEAFQSLVQNWRELSPGERYNTLRNYQEHERLPEDSRRDVEKSYERWQQMSPEERARVRQNYERLQQMPPQERDRMQRKYEKWRQEGSPSQ